MICLLSRLPLTISVPSETVVVLVYVLAPVNVKVFVPDLMSEPGPLRTPPKTRLSAAALTWCSPVARDIPMLIVWVLIALLVIPPFRVIALPLNVKAPDPLLKVILRKLLPVVKSFVLFVSRSMPPK